jgi:hypothetical protein
MRSKSGRAAVAVLAALLGAVAGAGPVRGADGPAAAGYHFLNLGASARLEALSGAGTAIAGPDDALSFNPALLARARSRAFAASWYTWMHDVQGGWFSGVQPLGRREAVGLAVRSLSVADFGNVPGEPDVGQSDLAVTAGYGRRVGPVDGGAAFRWIRSSLADEDATGWALDAGLAWEWVEGWDVAAAARNVGPAFAYGDGADEQLPTRGGAGLGGTLGELRLDGEVLWENGPGWVGALGAEWLWRNRLHLRAGTRVGQEADDAIEPWTAGFGLRVRDDLNLDYSFRDGLFDPSHRVGLRWSPAPAAGASDDEFARSPREFYQDVLNAALESGLVTFPDEAGGRLAVRPVDTHAADEVVSETLAAALRRRGYEVEILAAVPDLPEELDPAAAQALAEAGLGEALDAPVLEYEVVASTYEILGRRRVRWIGPQSVERRATVDLALALRTPDGTGPAWTGSARAEDTETVPRSRIPSSAGYPPAEGGTGVGKRKMHPLVEPAIVGGIVTGLAVIFFSNRDVGE